MKLPQHHFSHLLVNRKGCGFGVIPVDKKLFIMPQNLPTASHVSVKEYEVFWSPSPSLTESTNAGIIIIKIAD